MRILMSSHGYPPTISGVTLVVQKIARAMVRRGHAVTLVTASEHGEPYEAEDQGVRLVRVRSLPNPFWSEGPNPIARRGRLEEVIAEVQPDIIHVHEATLMAILLTGLAREAAVPVLATCYYVPRFVARYLSFGDEPSSLVETLTWGYTIRLFNRFDLVVFATVAHRGLFLEQGLEVPTRIISNGLDIERYRLPDGRPDDVETRLSLPPRPRLLFVSRLARDKEIDILIQAMPIIRRQWPAHLLLVGRGDDRSRLEDLVAELGLQEAVHFLGFVAEEDMPPLYRSVDLFAIASTCEVQSLPTLQAVATGLPVVAANALALPELVRDGENGFLVPPGDPVALAEAALRILSDPALAARMGQRSRALAEPHDERHTFDQYEALYQEMVGEGWAGDRQGPGSGQGVCPGVAGSVNGTCRPASPQVRWMAERNAGSGRQGA